MEVHLRQVRAVTYTVFMVVLCFITPSTSWAAHTVISDEGPVKQVQMRGARLNIYGEQLLSNPKYRVFFGADDADDLFEPRVVDYNASRIQLLLPFQPIPGRYRLKLGLTAAEPAVDVVLVIDDSRILIDHTTKGSADDLLKVADCAQDDVRCLAEAADDNSAFCGMAADFDPRQGSQAITVSETQALHLDDYYTIEARIFVREYVRGGIIVDKYSGSGRGREYRFSVGKDGQLRSWFSVDGTLENSVGLLSDMTVPKNRWVHVATANDAGMLRLFIDGTLVAESVVGARPAQLGYQNVAIGGNNCCRGYYEVFNGLIDEVRVSNTTRYVSTFEPPTEEFEADANTLLLMHFTDAGKNDGVLGGNAVPSALNPIRSCEVN